MTPNEKRAITERRNLSVKLTALRIFIGSGGEKPSPIYLKLPLDEQARLKTQEFHMSMYWRVLGDRIVNFPKDQPKCKVSVTLRNADIEDCANPTRTLFEACERLLRVAEEISAMQQPQAEWFFAKEGHLDAFLVAAALRERLLKEMQGDA